MSDDKTDSSRLETPSSGWAKQALSDYFDVMLGQVDESPLTELQQAETQGSGPEDASLEAQAVQGLPETRVQEIPSDEAYPDVPGGVPESIDDEAQVSRQDLAASSKSPDSDCLAETSRHSNYSASSSLTSGRVSDPASEKSQLKEQAKTKPTAELTIPTLAPPKLAPAPLVKAKVQPAIQEKTKTQSQTQTKVSDKERLAIKQMLRQQRATKEARLQAALKARNLSINDAIAARQPKVAEAPPNIQSSEPQAPAVTETQSASQGAQASPPSWNENGRPEWAQERFECLLFTVAGLKLAVPLVSLGSIHRLDSELTPLVGRAEWFLGLYRYGDRNIRVVDTARWVMPKLHHEGVVKGYEFIIRLGDGNWGVACDAVHEAIQLAPNQVKWRTHRSKRAWLSGTVIDHMCALLDADALASMLDFEVAQRVR